MRKRLVLPMVLTILPLCLLSLVVGGVAAWYVLRVHQQTSEDLAHNIAREHAVVGLEGTLYEVRTQMKNFLVTTDPKHLDAVIRLRTSVDYWLAEAERLTTLPHEQEHLAQIRGHYK